MERVGLANIFSFFKITPTKPSDSKSADRDFFLVKIKDEKLISNLICSFLNPIELNCLCLVNTSFQKISNENRLWKTFLKTEVIVNKLEINIPYHVKNILFKNPENCIDRYIPVHKIGIAYLESKGISGNLFLEKIKSGTHTVKDILNEKINLENQINTNIYNPDLTDIQRCNLNTAAVQTAILKGHITYEQGRDLTVAERRRLVSQGHPLSLPPSLDVFSYRFISPVNLWFLITLHQTESRVESSFF